MYVCIRVYKYAHICVYIVHVCVCILKLYTRTHLLCIYSYTLFIYTMYIRHTGNDWDRLRALLPNATHVLCHSEAVILGIRIYGCPWHWGYNANYTLKLGAPESNRCLSLIHISCELTLIMAHFILYYSYTLYFHTSYVYIGSAISQKI